MRLTKAEWQLMNALWQGHPATAREIQSRLPRETNWAYTTVKTMLSRLVTKGALSERKDGLAAMYSPLVSRRKARLSALRSMAEEVFDGSVGMLVHFLVEEENLSPSERKKLIDALKDEDKGGAK